MAHCHHDELLGFAFLRKDHHVASQCSWTAGPLFLISSRGTQKDSCHCPLYDPTYDSTCFLWVRTSGKQNDCISNSYSCSCTIADCHPDACSSTNFYANTNTNSCRSTAADSTTRCSSCYT